MKHFFLGVAAGMTRKERLRHTFAIGREKDREELRRYLCRHYGGKAILCKNGRSALALALKAYFNPGDAVIVNGFTCYAVYEAVKAAGLKPVFADISKENLNFDIDTLTKAMKSYDSRAFATTGANDEAPPVTTGRRKEARESQDSHSPRIRGIIIQNTLGNPVDIKAIEKFARKNDLIIIEDLAHCAGVKYPDGREAGTVGVASAWSFGKDKSIDTVSGGAVVLHKSPSNSVKAPSKMPKFADHMRARFYPLFGAMYQVLSYVKLNSVFMRVLLALHLVERSADNKLDLERKISKFEAKLALQQLKRLKTSGEPPLRDFYLVDDRDEVLKELSDKGYYFSGFWYEKPVSPKRYYKRVHFDEKNCPQAVFVAEHIVNLPNYYSGKDLAPAREIIEDYLMKEAQ